MTRRVLVSLAATLALLLGGTGAAEAARLRPLWLANYTITAGAPDAPATQCDDNWIMCGYVSVEATFAGLNRASWRPGPDVPPRPEASLDGTVQVSREYGCQNSAGKRLRTYDRTVSETANLGLRRGIPISFPREGDTVKATTWAFLADRQPRNCPAGTTPMMYRLTAKNVTLKLTSYVNGTTTGSYRAPGRSVWVGAVPTPTSAVANP